MYAQIFTSISDVFKSFFEFKKIRIENQSTTEIIDEKKDYKKATNIAEKLIKISSKYKSKMTFSDRLKYAHLLKDFFKYN